MTAPIASTTPNTSNESSSQANPSIELRHASAIAIQKTPLKKSSSFEQVRQDLSQSGCPTFSGLRITGDVIIDGLLDPPGLEFIPSFANSGKIKENTMWVDKTSINLKNTNGTLKMGEYQIVLLDQNITPKPDTIAYFSVANSLKSTGVVISGANGNRLNNIEKITFADGKDIVPNSNDSSLGLPNPSTSVAPTQSAVRDFIKKNSNGVSTGTVKTMWTGLWSHSIPGDIIYTYIPGVSVTLSIPSVTGNTLDNTNNDSHDSHDTHDTNNDAHDTHDTNNDAHDTNNDAHDTHDSHDTHDTHDSHDSHDTHDSHDSHGSHDTHGTNNNTNNNTNNDAHDTNNTNNDAHDTNNTNNNTNNGTNTDIYIRSTVQLPYIIAPKTDRKFMISVLCKSVETLGIFNVTKKGEIYVYPISGTFSRKKTEGIYATDIHYNLG
jgi:hypothetical protein